MVISNSAKRACAEICEMQQKRMDESFHIDAETARALIEHSIQEAIDIEIVRYLEVITPNLK